MEVAAEAAEAAAVTTAKEIIRYNFQVLLPQKSALKYKEKKILPYSYCHSFPVFYVNYALFLCL